MVKAYILVKVQVGSERDIFNKLKKMNEVEDVNELYGEWDIIAKVKVNKLEDLDSLISDKIRAVKEIKEVEGESDIIINSASGDSGLSRCAICSAAFVNGLKAFTVVKDEVILMPILKFSYYKILTDKKMEILKYLFSNQDCCSSLDELGRKLKMSLPLVSYHINGNLKSEGLKEMGLIVAEEFKGKVRITLTLLGRLIVKGYVR